MRPTYPTFTALVADKAAGIIPGDKVSVAPSGRLMIHRRANPRVSIADLIARGVVIRVDVLPETTLTEPESSPAPPRRRQRSRIGSLYRQ